MRAENEKIKLNYEQEILNIIRSKDSPKVIGDRLKEYHAKDLGEVLEILERKERESLYRLMDVRDLSELLEYTDDAEKYLSELDLKKAAEILANMEPDEAVDILKRTDTQRKKAWVELMEPDARKKLQMLASYDEDEIASRMTTNFVSLCCNASIKEAMNSVVAQAAEHDNISMIYVLDENRIYYGAISLKSLILAREGTNLEDIIVTAYPYVYADEKIDDCLEILKDYSEESIPVLSDDNHILGVITAQDMVEVVDEEMGEDYAMLAGLTAEEDLEEPVRESVKKRLPWLVLLLGLGLLVSSVVGVFEKVVAQLTIIICFQSLILDMAGNVGTQSLAVTIRVLMDEHLTGKQKLKLVGKEIRVGFTNGLILGTLSFAGIGVYIMLFKNMAPGMAFAISGCIGIALLMAMVVSSLVGTVIPLLFKQAGVDPAVASGPLITTINDLVAVVAYYGLTWIMLIKVMHIG
ncbi:MAG: magnesium transporter [Blautia sp.]|nr:magnesium transporter [Eubacteriales bacterium]MED9966862.1 magnesium transporter [Blautia sp.]